MNNRVYKVIQLLVFFLFIAAIVVQAQPEAPPAGGGSGDPVGGTGVPLDGGILSVLLAGGIAYAASVRKKKKDKEE